MRASVGQWTLVAMMLAAMTGCQSGSSGLAWNKWRFGKGNDETAIASNNGPVVEAPALPSQGATPTSVGPYSTTNQIAGTNYGITPPGASSTPYAPSQGGYTLPGGTPYSPAQPAGSYASTTPGGMTPQAGYYNPNYDQASWNNSTTYPEAQVAGGYPSTGYAAPTSATTPATGYPNTTAPLTADNRYSSSPSTADRYPSTGSLAAPSDYGAGQTGYQPGAMTDNPVGGTSYQPGSTSYQPGDSSYTPGNTGYQAPAQQQYQTPAPVINHPRSSTKCPARVISPPRNYLLHRIPYRPGNERLCSFG